MKAPRFYGNQMWNFRLFKDIRYLFYWCIAKFLGGEFVEQNGKGQKRQLYRKKPSWKIYMFPKELFWLFLPSEI